MYMYAGISVVGHDECPWTGVAADPVPGPQRFPPGDASIQ
jgi:hypothetical protein